MKQLHVEQTLCEKTDMVYQYNPATVRIRYYCAQSQDNIDVATLYYLFTYVEVGLRGAGLEFHTVTCTCTSTTSLRRISVSVSFSSSPTSDDLCDLPEPTDLRLGNRLPW
jgi:hypothetical protein